MTKFSANLGFLWNNLPLPDAIHAAKNAGFDAVECHWPYDYEVEQVRQALSDTGLQMLGLNTRRGDVKGGENGLSALPGRETDARAAIDEAIDYAQAIGCGKIHIMAGFASGKDALKTFNANLAYACDRAAQFDQIILIEPLNSYDAPGYFLQTVEQAREIIEGLGAASLRLMFDCYHAQLMGGDLTNRLKSLLPIIGHIQFASAPDRGPPDTGEIHYRHIFHMLKEWNYADPLGAEYKPKGATEDSLDWMGSLR